MPYTDPKDRAECLRRFRKRNPNYDSEWLRQNGYAAQKAWKARNPRRVNGYVRKRQALVVTTTVELVDYTVVLEKARGHCKICRKPFGRLKVEIDHKVPLARGGTHTYDNLQAVHAVCNRRKGAKIL